MRNTHIMRNPEERTRLLMEVDKLAEGGKEVRLACKKVGLKKGTYTSWKAKIANGKDLHRFAPPIGSAKVGGGNGKETNHRGVGRVLSLMRIMQTLTPEELDLVDACFGICLSQKQN